MSMPSFPSGYYDDKGQWQRSKFCFVDCGASCTCKPPIGLYYSEQHDKSKQQGKYQPGQRVIYTKRGESRHYDTEWHATYVELTPSGRHSIRIDGRKRKSIVRDASLRPYSGEGESVE